MADLATCVLCPRLCRSACPVATGTAREAATPTALATVVHQWRTGQVDATLARQASTLCVDCGRCEAHCHLGQPLPAWLREVRAELLPPEPVEPLAQVVGHGAWVAIECDDRPLGRVVAALVGEPVATLRTRDGLGHAVLGTARWGRRTDELGDRLAGRVAVVSDGASARAVAGAGLRVRWLHELAPDRVVRRSCAAGADRCCGGAWPLVRFHPVDAARMATRYTVDSASEPLADARCRDHLLACGHAATDLLDLLIHEIAEL